MALLPDTPATRMVPVAGRQMAERRFIRGAGAAERSVGTAWGRLTSRQREHYGSQRNFAKGLQNAATERAIRQQEADDDAEMERGRQDALAGTPGAKIARPAPAPSAPVNHAKDTIKKPVPAPPPAMPRPVDPALIERRGFGNPARKAASLEDAVRGGRIKDTFGKNHANFQQESHRRFAARRQRPKSSGLYF